MMTSDSQPVVAIVESADDLFVSEFHRRYTTSRELKYGDAQGKIFRIQNLDPAQVAAYQTESYNTACTKVLRTRMADANQRLIRRCCVDSKGNPIFTRDHDKKFVRWDYVDVKALYKDCAEWCGLDDESEAEGKNDEGESESA